MITCPDGGAKWNHIAVPRFDPKQFVRAANTCLRAVNDAEDAEIVRAGEDMFELIERLLSHISVLEECIEAQGYSLRMHRDLLETIAHVMPDHVILHTADEEIREWAKKNDIVHETADADLKATILTTNEDAVAFKLRFL